MLNWFYTLIERRKIASLATLPFALIKKLKENVSGTIYGILQNTEKDYLRLKELYNQYQVKHTEEAACYYHKDEHGVVEELPRPLFTSAQVASMRKQKISYSIGMVLFLILETIFFYMIGANLSGGIGKVLTDMGRGAARYEELVYVAIGFLFAIVSGFTLDTGLSKVYEFISGREHFKDGKISKAQYKTVVFNFCLGIFMLFIVISMLVVMNVARAKAIDGGNGNSHNDVLAWALTIASILVGIWLGIAKKTLSKVSPMLVLNAKWEKLKKELQSIHNEATRTANTIYLTASLGREKCYQLALDTQEILRREIDERDTEILAEYKSKDQLGDMPANEQNIRRYGNLSTNERKLMEEQFNSSQRLSEVMNDTKHIENAIDKAEAERLEALTPTNQQGKSEEDMIVGDKELDASIKVLINQ